MLFLPKGALPEKMNGAGYARGRSSGGYWLRARASVVNPNTPNMSSWRQIFCAAKINYRATQEYGADTVPLNDILPAEAWTIQASGYSGILLDGLIQNGMQEQGTLIGCASTEAYQVMVQTTLASMGLAMLPTPTINTSYLATDTATQNESVGDYTAILSIPTMPPVDPLTFNAGVGIEITGNDTTTWTASLVIPPAGVGATLSASSFSLVYNSVAGTSEGGVNVTFTISPYTTPRACNISIIVTGPGGTATFTVHLVVTTGTAVSALPPPTFAFPNSLYASTEYDSDMNAIGFYLTYSAVGVTNFPMSRNGVESQGTWLITASARYKSSYSKPSTATWSPILASGPYMPNAAEILAAWEEKYGALPASGHIAFRAQYADQQTGCPGPALRCVASWENGTLLGCHIAGWDGKKFVVTNGSVSGDVTAGESAELTIYVQGANGYSGTITFSVKPKMSIPTGSSNTTYAMPPGVTFTINPASLTIAADDTSIHTVTAIAPITADMGDYEFKAALEGTDGIETLGGSATFQITGCSGSLPDANFISIDPGYTPLPVVLGGTAGAKLTIKNTCSNSFQVIMLASNSDTDLTFEFGQGGTADATSAVVFSKATGPVTPATPIDWGFEGITYDFANTSAAVDPGHSYTIPITVTPAGTDSYTFTLPTGLTGITVTLVYNESGVWTGITFTVAWGRTAGVVQIPILFYNSDSQLISEAISFYITVAAVISNTITYAIVTRTEVNALVDSDLTSTGYAPTDYNVTDAPILSNDATSVTVNNTTNPGAMTAVGIAGVIDNNVTVPAGTMVSPGTASVTVFVKTVAALTKTLRPTQIEASSGINTSYSVVDTAAT